MHTIYKYALGPTSVLQLPEDAQPLTVQCQQGEPVLWVKLDPQAPTQPRTFVCYGTGHPLDATTGQQYLATFQLANGLVFHVFEEHIHA